MGIICIFGLFLGGEHNNHFPMMFLPRIILFLFLLFPLTSFAESTEQMHLQSAFTFAKKQDWNNAIVHAKAAHSELLVKYFVWEFLKDPESEASFKQISDFIDENPEWPDLKVLINRAEAALLSENPSNETLDRWYEKYPSRTMKGKKRNIKSKEELNNFIRDAWVEDDYTRAEESRMLSNYRDVLRSEDHARRIDRLLWEDKEAAAKRLLPLVSAGSRLLAETRIAFKNSDSHAKRLFARLPASARNNPGLIYERMRYHARKGDREDVRALLLQAPATVPYPEKWWNYRERQVREAVREGKYSIAEKLLAHHGQDKEGAQEKEARWLQGWIALEFRGNARPAYDIFESLYDDLETPGSKARAAYWAARAAQSMKAPSTSWFQDAAKYSTTFYGQLAMLELEHAPLLSIRSDDSDASSEDKKSFRTRELVKLVGELARAKQTNLASKFILYMVERAKSPKEAVLASHLGRDINRIDIGVRASKKALKDGIVALESGYPVIRVNETAGLEKSYVLALMRQESEFFADAISTSGALGLMQLLPSTAREIARKASMLPFTPDRLFDAAYNMGIGSRYLSSLVTRFDGSYVLATASYNAGPGRVRQWLGDGPAPGNSVHSVVNWIESIPLSETRNYVQHVMGNMQVYRYILAGHKPTALSLGDDLVRGAQ